MDTLYKPRYVSNRTSGNRTQSFDRVRLSTPIEQNQTHKNILPILLNTILNTDIECSIIEHSISELLIGQFIIRNKLSQLVSQT